jgi:hypothetical protein
LGLLEDIIAGIQYWLGEVLKWFGLDQVKPVVDDTNATADRIESTSYQIDGQVGIIDGKMVYLATDLATNKMMLVVVERDQSQILGDTSNLKTTAAMYLPPTWQGVQTTQQVAMTVNTKMDTKPTIQQLNETTNLLYNQSTTNTYNITKAVQDLWRAWLTESRFMDIWRVASWFIDLATGKALEEFYRDNPEVGKE